MKAAGEYEFAEGDATLYPTWFRWKKILNVRSSGISLTLYPTWFRWKYNYND